MLRVVGLILAFYVAIVSGRHGRARIVTTDTISGSKAACLHKMTYDVNPSVKFQLCLAQTDQYLNVSGNSVTGMIQARGFMPTCRVMQLMLWMRAIVSHNALGTNERESLFVDVGANIGACSMSIAALGYPVISFEPVPEHIAIMQGTLAMNPLFSVTIHQGGVSYEDRRIQAKFSRQPQNWGGTTIEEGAGDNATDLTMWALDSVLHGQQVALLKIDCEGCEYATLKGAGQMLKHIQMIKMEFIETKYTAGAVTVTDREVLRLLEDAGFDLYMDHWREMGLYHGGKRNRMVGIDKVFGSARFNEPCSNQFLDDSAKRILRESVQSATFSAEGFQQRSMDIIAIQKPLSEAMKKRWL